MCTPITLIVGTLPSELGDITSLEQLELKELSLTGTRVTV